MANKVQEKTTGLNVELLKNAVVSDTEPTFRAPGQAVMRIGCKACSQIVHFALHVLLDDWREVIERFAVYRRPNLESCAHPRQG